MEYIFTNIYENSVWGNNNNKEYKGSSGLGSEIEYNKDYIPLLKKIINDYNVKSVVDLGCGDFRIGKLVYDDIDVVYTGYDAYKGVVEYNTTQHLTPKYTFKHLDFYRNKEEIIEGDMCILKDVLQHWPLYEIYSFLDYLVDNKKFKYILTVNCCHDAKDNVDIRVGGYRQLSHECLPLKKYNPNKLGNYHSKEVSIIKVYE